MKIYHIFYADTVAKIRFADGTIQEIRGPAAEIIDTSTEGKSILLQQKSFLEPLQ